MILALNGYKGSGKDTVAEYLEVAHGFYRMSFARLLKQSIAALFDIPEESLEVSKNSPKVGIVLTENGKFISMRSLLQRYGTEAHRDVFGANFWVEQLFGHMPSSADRVVISDCRFVNEAEAVMKFDGLVLRINRFPSDDDHASEQPLPDYLVSGEIDNTGDLSTLYKKLDVIVASAELNRRLNESV